MDLKSLIESIPECEMIPCNSDGAVAVAEILNASADPLFYVWRTEVPTIQIAENITDWTFLDDMDAGRSALWQMIVRQDTLNVSKPGIRSALVKIVKGDAAIIGALRPLMIRPATVAEKFTAVGTGTIQEPATAVFVGAVTPKMIENARVP